MDAIEFYHTDECSTDIYEAMEQFAKEKADRIKELEEAIDSIMIHDNNSCEFHNLNIDGLRELGKARTGKDLKPLPILQ